MRSKIVMEGNAFYEIDEDCMRRKAQEEAKEKKERRTDKEK